MTTQHEFKIYVGKNAKKCIRDFIKIQPEFDDLCRLQINNWLNSSYGNKCFTLHDNGNIKVIACLSNNDFDPLGIHTKPYTLDFIYTVPKYRRNNLSCDMLLHLKTREELTAFCDNDASENLFMKAGFIQHGYDDCGINPRFRFP
jgi:RimJ/RimL family protein N-acetyltransferase